VRSTLENKQAQVTSASGLDNSGHAFVQHMHATRHTPRTMSGLMSSCDTGIQRPVLLMLWCSLRCTAVRCSPVHGRSLLRAVASAASTSPPRACMVATDAPSHAAARQVWTPTQQVSTARTGEGTDRGGHGAATRPAHHRAKGSPTQWARQIPMSRFSCGGHARAPQKRPEWTRCQEDTSPRVRCQGRAFQLPPLK
jgi:hypothetical protein